MDDNLISLLVGIASGAAGYWISVFWMKPILRYIDLRSEVLSDLIYYAQVTNADGLNELMKKRFLDRVESNRRVSADLYSCILELPYWYLCWLKFKGCDPEAAAQDLIGLSNTTEHAAASKRTELIKKALGIKSSVI